MIRIAVPAFGLLFLAASIAPVFAEGANLTRIEPRGVYGATVTMENGVRVTRPLPPTGTMIINPGNATPLNLRIDQHPNADERSDYHRR